MKDLSKAATLRIGKSAVAIFKQVARCPLQTTTAGPHKPLDFYEVKGELVAQCEDCGCTLTLTELLRDAPEYAGKCD